jgi:hypothetical protein
MDDDRTNEDEAESFGLKAGVAVAIPMALAGAGSFALFGFMVAGCAACGLFNLVKRLSK